jgi:hypothetical protein
LKTRDKERYRTLLNKTSIEPHPIFKIVDGEIEDWEKAKSNLQS